MSKEQKLKQLQNQFEDSKKYWQDARKKAKEEDKIILENYCEQKEEKYDDLLKLLRILNE